MFNLDRQLIKDLSKEDLKLPEFDEQITELDDDYRNFFQSKFQDWGKQYHSRKEEIEHKLDIHILGQGKNSVVFTSDELPDKYVMSYAKSMSEADNSFERQKDPERRLIEKTFRSKHNFYLNRIMNELFPGSVAKIHYSSVHEEHLYEVTVREKIEGVMAGFKTWEASEIPKHASRIDTMNILEIKNLLYKKRIPITLDAENINNVLVRKDGSECYVDGELHFLEGEGLGDREEYSFENILELMDELHITERKQHKVLKWVDRAVSIEAEHQERLKSIKST